MIDTNLRIIWNENDLDEWHNFFSSALFLIISMTLKMLGN